MLICRFEVIALVVCPVLHTYMNYAIAEKKEGAELPRVEKGVVMPFLLSSDLATCGMQYVASVVITVNGSTCTGSLKTTA